MQLIQGCLWLYLQMPILIPKQIICFIKGDSEYDCELRQYEEHWALQANKTKLNSIKYQDTPLELTETNINTINAMGDM